MTHQEIYSTLKSILAELTGRRRKNIRARHNLVSDLRFTAGGKSALNVDINKGFAKENSPIHPPLRPSETRSATTVRDLRVLISRRFDS